MTWPVVCFVKLLGAPQGQHLDKHVKCHQGLPRSPKLINIIHIAPNTLQIPNVGKPRQKHASRSDNLKEEDPLKKMKLIPCKNLHTFTVDNLQGNGGGVRSDGSCKVEVCVWCPLPPYSLIHRGQGWSINILSMTITANYQISLISEREVTTSQSPQWYSCQESCCIYPGLWRQLWVEIRACRDKMHYSSHNRVSIRFTTTAMVPWTSSNPATHSHYGGRWCLLSSCRTIYCIVDPTRDLQDVWYSRLRSSVHILPNVAALSRRRSRCINVAAGTSNAATWKVICIGHMFLFFLANISHSSASMLPGRRRRATTLPIVAGCRGFLIKKSLRISSWSSGNICVIQEESRKPINTGSCMEDWTLLLPIHIAISSTGSAVPTVRYDCTGTQYGQLRPATIPLKALLSFFHEVLFCWKRCSSSVYMAWTDEVFQRMSEDTLQEFRNCLKNMAKNLLAKSFAKLSGGKWPRWG